jgi:hypothetical protein
MTEVITLLSYLSLQQVNLSIAEQTTLALFMTQLDHLKTDDARKMQLGLQKIAKMVDGYRPSLHSKLPPCLAKIKKTIESCLNPSPEVISSHDEVPAPHSAESKDKRKGGHRRTKSGSSAALDHTGEKLKRVVDDFAALSLEGAVSGAAPLASLAPPIITRPRGTQVTSRDEFRAAVLSAQDIPPLKLSDDQIPAEEFDLIFQMDAMNIDGKKLSPRGRKGSQ